MRLLVGAQHTRDMPRGKAIYPERLGQAQVCFQIAPFFLRALVRLLAQGTRHLEAHLHTKHETHRVAALGGLLASTKDGCRSAVCDTPHYLSPASLGTSQATVEFRAFLGYQRLPYG